MAKKTITVNSNSESGMKVETFIRDFELVTDQPEEKGGTNEGPTPSEYLLGSLGSCICITSRIVADKMDLNVVCD